MPQAPGTLNPVSPMQTQASAAAPASPATYLMAAASMHNDGSLQAASRSAPVPTGTPLGRAGSKRKLRVMK